MTSFQRLASPTRFGPATTRPPRPSAALVLVREGIEGPEVLLVRRADRGDQNSNAWVFPGGLIDASDTALHAHCFGLDDVAASARLGLQRGGLDYLIAALRETLEEAGLLLGVDADGAPLGAAAHRLLADWREHSRRLPPGQGGAALAELLQAHRWRLAVDTLTPISHWITPVGLPKRFDTWFVLATTPSGQTASVDGVEVVEHRWVRPASALLRDAPIQVIGPARTILQDLAAHTSVQAIMAWAAGLGSIRPIQPRLGRDAEGRIGPVHPRHAAFAEVGHIDPLGQGHACHEISPGRAVHLAPDVIRVTAPQGRFMTGPGSNSYLLGCEHEGPQRPSTWVLIDPGPDDPDHLQALMRHLPGRLLAILVTHTPPDHSPAARRLKTLTGAPIYGRIAGRPEWQEPHCKPDVALQGGERLSFGRALQLQVIHAPGHASNHLCFLHEQRRMLFTGDPVMQGSTAAITPADGDTAAGLAALQQLNDQVDAAAGGFDWIAPGHGFLMNPKPIQADATLPPPPRTSAGCAPLRRAHSVRRTSSVDASWPQGRDQAVAFDARARDLLTRDDGMPPEVKALDRVLARIGTDRTIESISTSPPRPDAQRLVGARGGGYLRSALDAALPAEQAAGSPLYLLIDDFAGASLIAGWAWKHWGGTPEAQGGHGLDPAMIAARFAKMENICTGFATGSSALQDRIGERQNFAPVEPLPNPADPVGWHELPQAGGVTMRRARRIDIWREGHILQIDAMFQDSASVPTGGRVAVHEYTLQAQADLATLCLTAVQAQPRILPYAECPGAVRHLDRLLGTPLHELRSAVLQHLPGTLGCTHLNDALRSLAEVPVLLALLDQDVRPA